MSTVQSKVRIDLTTDEAAHLHEALTAYLSELRKETSRTDDKEFRDHLWDRERVIEGVLSQLSAAG